MRLFVDAFWRAAAYCLHPRVILLSLLPLLLIAGGAVLLGWLFWEPALDAVRATMSTYGLFETVFGWLDGAGLGGFRAVFPPLVVVLVSTPVIVIVSLLTVAALMTPAMVSLVAQRRFPELEKRRGGSLVGSLFGAAWATLAALLALLVSMPLWFVPPLVLVLPPLIWGWLTYRVMSYDVLADHATREERQALMRAHRMPLLAIGVITGYLGAAPTLLWVSGAAMLVLAPLLIAAAVWIYTLVFAFSSLWFAHHALAALAERREADRVIDMAPPPAQPPAGAADVTPLIPLP